MYNSSTHIDTFTDIYSPRAQNAHSESAGIGRQQPRQCPTVSAPDRACIQATNVLNRQPEFQRNS